MALPWLHLGIQRDGSPHDVRVQLQQSLDGEVLLTVALDTFLRLGYVVRSGNLHSREDIVHLLFRHAHSRVEESRQRHEADEEEDEEEQDREDEVDDEQRYHDAPSEARGDGTWTSEVRKSDKLRYFHTRGE